MANFLGRVATDDTPFAAVVKPQYFRKIALLQPDRTPLYSLLLQKSVAIVAAMKQAWWQDALGANSTTAAATVNSSATTVAVTDGTIFTADDLILNETTNEVIRFTSNDSNTITIVRAVTALESGGGTAAAAITSGDVLRIIGNAREEGASLRNQNVTTRTEVYNHLQVFEDTLDFTVEADQTEVYGENGSERDIQRTKKEIEHLLRIEYAILLGERGKLTATSGVTHPVWMTRGLKAWIQTQTSASTGSLTEAKMLTFAQKAFRYGSKTKIMFAGKTLLQAIAEIELSHKRTLVGKTVGGVGTGADVVGGISVVEYVTPFGTLLLKDHELMQDSAALAGVGIVADLDVLQLMFLANKGRTLHKVLNLEDTTGQQAVQEYWVTRVGLCCEQEKQCAMISGVTG